MVSAQNTLVDGVNAGVDIALVSDGLCHFGFIAQAGVNPFASFENGCRHSACSVGVFLDELCRGAEHFLRMVFPDVLGGHGGHADAVNDGAVVPRLAHTKAVHVAHAHVGHHLRGWHGNDFGVFDGVDAVGRHPVVKPHRVGTCGEGLCERVFTFFFGHQFGQAWAVYSTLVC